MKLLDALTEFDRLDKLYSRYIFSKTDLRIIFPEENETTLTRSIERLVKNQILIRAGKSVFIYARAHNKSSYLLEDIAKAMRPFEINYVSLESALSEQGLISQIPVSYLTIITTGRSGTYKTPFGTIEFTHTKRSQKELLKRFNTTAGRPLPIAGPQAALDDLKRVGRNTTMIDMDVVSELNLKAS